MYCLIQHLNSTSLFSQNPETTKIPTKWRPPPSPPVSSQPWHLLSLHPLQVWSRWSLQLSVLESTVQPRLQPPCSRFLWKTQTPTLKPSAPVTGMLFPYLPIWFYQDQIRRLHEWVSRTNSLKGRVVSLELKPTIALIRTTRCTFITGSTTLRTLILESQRKTALLVGARLSRAIAGNVRSKNHPWFSASGMACSR